MFMMLIRCLVIASDDIKLSSSIVKGVDEYGNSDIGSLRPCNKPDFQDIRPNGFRSTIE